MDDWRLLGQEHFLTGAKLVRSKYLPPSTRWDHDHCEFCGKKFSLSSADLHEGYVTLDDKHWICEQCFHDFQGRFGWIVVQEEAK